MAMIDRLDRLTLAVGAICCLGLMVWIGWAGLNPLEPSYYSGSILIYLLIALILTGINLARHFYIERPASPIRSLFDLLARPQTRAVALRIILFAALLSLFSTQFSIAKASIGRVREFEWDATFIALDRLIHGGDAWQLLQPVLGHPIITRIIAGIYHAWLVILFVGNLYFIFFERNDALRTRYFVSYFLCWTVIGVAMATALASVGPCFVGPLFGNQLFAGQMAYLHNVDAQYPLLVLDVQQRLVEWYRTDTVTLGAGISAMPSMHVSHAVLLFLALRNKGRIVAWALGIFAFAILLGTVHLAYHYAVDGYVAIAMTLLIWWGAGRLVRKVSAKSA